VALLFYERLVEGLRGYGEEGWRWQGFRPHELLEAALASCINISVRMEADEQGFPLEGVATEVELKRSIDGAVFRYSVEFEGELSEEQERVLREAASECPVHETLSGGLEFWEA